jgi:hypothetical protein
VVRVVFVGGLGRSGTTLLERILGELPGVCPLGEVVHLWERDLVRDERCGCGHAFSRCAFWQAVGEQAFGGWARVRVDRMRALGQAVDRTRHIPHLARRHLPTRYQRPVAEYVGHYARVYRAAAQVSGARVVVDSSKHSALAFGLRWSPSIDLRVIHMVRDSRGVAYSWTKTVPRPESTGEQMTRYPPGRSALLWNAHNTAFGLLAHRGVPVYRVRYETLLAQPRTVVAKLADFAGIPAGPLEFVTGTAVRLGTSHTAAGNPMRFATGEVPLRPDDAWRTELPAGQRRLVGALTAPLLVRYGYGRRAR